MPSSVSFSSSPSRSSIPNPSPTSTSTSTSTPIPTPTTRHTASQSLSPSHIPADSPSSPLIQRATSIPGIEPPSPTTISVLAQLQNLLDITSTLLGLFFVSILTILFIYWSSIYILRKMLGIKSSERIGIWGSSVDDQRKKASSNGDEKGGIEKKKKEVGFEITPDPSPENESSKYSKKAQEIKRRLSSVQSTPSQTPKNLPKETTPIAGLGNKPISEKETIAKIAASTDYNEMGEATGRKPEDIRADVDLEFQRGVADVRGDVDADAVERRGGGSYGVL
ncbi:hypothetical protein EAF04_007454 [Stromatinia cepivora]|nr:hypothetical protein EAF04_007454 [Stromatinia cepivora]